MPHLRACPVTPACKTQPGTPERPVQSGATLSFDLIRHPFFEGRGFKPGLRGGHGKEGGKRGCVRRCQAAKTMQIKAPGTPRHLSKTAPIPKTGVYSLPLRDLFINADFNDYKTPPHARLTCRIRRLTTHTRLPRCSSLVPPCLLSTSSGRRWRNGFTPNQ